MSKQEKKEYQERIDALQQLFHTKTKEDKVKTLTEKYHKYKKEYAKHLSFKHCSQFFHFR